MRNREHLAFGRWTYEEFSEADRIARQLARLEKEDDIASFGPRILALMKGVHWNVFTLLDEKPGRWGYMNDRFYMLRRVRNSPEWGKRMFESLTR